MGSEATLVATLTREPTDHELIALSEQASVLEVRADLFGDPDPERLRRHFPGRLLYTLRSKAEGGLCELSSRRRRERLRVAAPAYDLIDLEADRDADPELLAVIPPRRRLISWHGPAHTFSELSTRFEEMSGIEAGLYKLVPAAGNPRQVMAPLALLHSVQRNDVIAFCGGRQGTWTRFLSPRLGAPWIYGAAGDEPGAPGQLPLAVLRDDYGLPAQPEIDRLFGVVGDPVLNSLSPRLYNRLFRLLGVSALYLPFEVEGFGDFWLDIVESGSLLELGFDLKGLSITAPHKEIAMAVSGAMSPLAEHIGSANTLVSSNGVWEGESTDHEGLLAPLRTRDFELRGRPAAVIGAGGAGRAAAFGLAQAGAEVTLVNRGEERGRRAAAELRLQFVPLANLDPGRFDLLVNATPQGRFDDALPFAPEALSATAMVVDLAYRDGCPTELVQAVRDGGRRAIDGREVLLCQAIPQFRMMVGRDLVVEEAKRILELGEE